MSTFVYDSFTDTDGVNLENHIGELGAIWTKLNTGAGEIVITNANRARAGATDPSGNRIYKASGTPLSADYTVQATISQLSQTGFPAICARLTDINNMYIADAGPSGSSLEVDLYKMVSGTQTLLQTITMTRPTGDFELRLDLQGTTLKVYVNGVMQITKTDSSLSSKGSAGLRISGAAETDTTSYQWNDFTALDLGARRRVGSSFL